MKPIAETIQKVITEMKAPITQDQQATDLKQKFAEWLHIETFGDPELEKMVNCCYEWHMAFSSTIKKPSEKSYPLNPKQPRWLSILGVSGTGKTHCCKRLWEWSKSWSDFSRSSYSPMVIYWPGFVQSLKGGDAFKMRDDMRSWPVLFLDDVGAERDGSGFATDELNALLGYRVGRWTLITSNRDFDSIKAMDGRIASRIVRGENICVGIETKDFAERNKISIGSSIAFPIKKALIEKAISIDDLKSSLEWAKSNTPNAKENIATLERRIKEMEQTKGKI